MRKLRHEKIRKHAQGDMDSPWMVKLWFEPSKLIPEIVFLPLLVNVRIIWPKSLRFKSLRF